MTSLETQNKGNLFTKLAVFGVSTFVAYKCYHSMIQKTKNVKDYSVANARNEEKQNMQLPENIDHSFAYISISLTIKTFFIKKIVFNVALAAALDAGQTIKEFINDSKAKQSSISLKSIHTDFCTAIDKKCEDIILNKYILKNFPTHKIIAEESCLDANNITISDHPTWVIDPIDGTTNFVHDLYLVGICIGLRINQRSVLGVVHFPILNETYFAIQGSGAYVIKNGDLKTKKQIFVSKSKTVTDLKSCMVLTEVGYGRDSKYSRNISERIYKLLFNEKIRGLRMFGACSLNMIAIASGKADVFYEGSDSFCGPKPWDFTAPEIIVYEAGGYCCLPEDVDRQPFDCTQGRILCCSSYEIAKYIEQKVGLYSKEEIN